MTKSKVELENEDSVRSPTFDSLFNLYQKGILDAKEIYNIFGIYNILGLGVDTADQKLKEDTFAIKDTVCKEERS
jgi:hypothetical protein